MAVLSNLKPEKVFHYFEEISQIPRGSGNTEGISQYCLDFAEKHGLKAVRDDGGNVFIYSSGTEEYENSEPIIIQGHMDMVCDKTPDCYKNLEKEGLDLHTDGEFVWAEGTTLGGDDGIALAYMFALLDSEDIPHPPLECVITRDEETGMFGAKLFDASLVSGRRLLNIDSEEEGILTVSCAGGVSVHCGFSFDARYINPSFKYEISVSGLRGGHSGVDIGKGRLNAFRLLSEPLSNVNNCYFGTIMGGGKQNVIPQNASVIFGSDEDKFNELEEIIRICNEKKYGGDSEPELLFSVKEISDDEKIKFFENKTYFGFVYDFLRLFPTGVQKMSESIEDMVETSLNLGVLEINGAEMHCDFLIRSNTDSGKDEVIETVRSFTRSLSNEVGFNGITLSDDYPAWEYREESQLRDTMAEVYRELYGKEPIISCIHAGLECAVFSHKMKDADLVSIGPDIHNIHTPDEKLDIASAERTWEYLKAVLKAMK